MSPSQTEEVENGNMKLFAWTQLNVLLKKKKTWCALMVDEHTGSDDKGCASFKNR